MLYVIASKTMYIPDLIEKVPLAVVLPVKYYAAHLPLYPLLIRVFAPIFNYAKSMIFVNIAATIGLALFFYYLVRHFKLTRNPIVLTTVFLMLPRFLVIRSIGAPESLFLLLILLSLFYFEKEKYFLSGLFGGLATMTKTPGILLFVTYIFVLLEKYFRNRSHPELISGSDSKKQIPKQVRNDNWINWRWLYILLIPFGLLLVFYFYQIQYRDFFAYFHSGDNIHLVFPFAVFNLQSRWVGTAWLEDIIFYYFLYTLTVIFLKESKYRSFFYFAIVFFSATAFVQHRDIGRYSLPLWPMASIALEKFLTSKKFLIALVILIPAIYMYAWNFSLQNVMPVTEWSFFFSK